MNLLVLEICSLLEYCWEKVTLEVAVFYGWLVMIKNNTIMADNG
jgi:hypothetical protein